MIQLIGVSRTVPSGAGPLTILHPTSFGIARGRAVAITGASGSGKSTLLGLMAGLDAPTTGQILLDGVDITALGEEAMARLRGDRIGIVFQFFHLLPSLTAFENVLVPMEIAGTSDAPVVRRLIREVGLATGPATTPRSRQAVSNNASRRARWRMTRRFCLPMSPPEPRQRDGAARHRPLVDVNRRRGCTLVLVTHDAELAGRADEILMLRDGRWLNVAPRRRVRPPHELCPQDAVAGDSNVLVAAELLLFCASASALPPSSPCAASSRTSKRPFTQEARSLIAPTSFCSRPAH
jgi:putative ABC transport system ATP-binding protein